MSVTARGYASPLMEQRVALVTGGARGIGRAVALAISEQGRAVAIGDVLEEEAAQTARAIGRRALAVPLDVTDPKSVAAAVERTQGELGAIDVLVNNAGLDEARPFIETDEAYWDRVIEITFKGDLRVTRAVLPGMVERRWDGS